MTAQPAWNVLMRTCPSRTSLAEIANKWSAMVVIVLLDGRRRFTEIRTAVDGISGKVLTDTLRRLERDGILTRTVHPEVPPRVEYELTDLGRSLEQPLTALRQWAETHIDEVLDHRETYDDRLLP